MSRKPKTRVVQMKDGPVAGKRLEYDSPLPYTLVVPERVSDSRTKFHDYHRDVRQNHKHEYNHSPKCPYCVGSQGLDKDKL